MTPKIRIVVGLAIFAVVYAVAVHFNLVPGARKQASAVPTGFTLATDAPDAATSTPVSFVALPLPSTALAAVKQPIMRFSIWEWNAQFGLLYAVGGPQTTKGSAMERHGITVKLTRQDNTNISQGEQIKFANALAGGNPNPPDGVHFVVIMGDQTAGYLAGANKELSALGEDYRAEVIGAVGYSYGEDAWWGPSEWKDSAEAMKGGATAGVLREGDWNIAQYKLANDGIKNNPDEKTWDPDAMNWFAADDYLKASELYINGYCEDRPVVRLGKLTNEKHKTCVQGVVTWTPGDVNLAKGKGGLVRLLSTKENVYQMPAVIVGIHKWNVSHAKQIQNMLAGIFEGSDQVRTRPEALNKAGQISFAVYADQTPGYWVKYYKGVVERDKQGQPVPLGGSRVANLADNLVLFGLAEGTGGIGASLWKATYEGFGTIAKQQYPRLVPAFPSAEQAANTQFLQALASEAQPNETSNATLETFDETTSIEKVNVVAQRNWSIQFDTGRATFTPQAEQTLNTLYQQLIVGGALQVEIDGHTDNVGNPSANQALSEARARAVEMWLTSRAGKLFPQNRITVKGFGDTQPIASNTTEFGRAQNRRVTIVLGAKG